MQIPSDTCNWPRMLGLLKFLLFFFAKSLLIWFSDSFGRWISRKMGDLVIQNHVQVKRALIVF